MPVSLTIFPKTDCHLSHAVYIAKGITRIHQKLILNAINNCSFSKMGINVDSASFHDDKVYSL